MNYYMYLIDYGSAYVTMLINGQCGYLYGARPITTTA